MIDSVKAAYGLGCQAQLDSQNIETGAFIKAAAAGSDDDMHMAADALLCVEHLRANNPALLSKVAASLGMRISFEKESSLPSPLLQPSVAPPPAEAPDVSEEIRSLLTAEPESPAEPTITDRLGLGR